MGIFREWGDKLSELHNMVFGETDENSSENTGNEIYEIDGQVTLSEAYSPDIRSAVQEQPEMPAAPEELISESIKATQRMKQEIEQETAALDKRFAEAAVGSRSQAVQHKRRPVYVIGVLSSAASLIFMGIMLTISLSSPIGPYLALKAAPFMLVFIGAEILFAVFSRKTLRIKIDIRSVIVVGALIALSAALTLISTNSSADKNERIYAEQRIQNMLANELHNTIAKDYIRSVDIETQLFAEDILVYSTPADLTDGDIINLTINFSDAQMTIREFAKDCREVLDNIKKLSYNFGHIDFIADDSVNHYTLNIDWLYQSDYDAEKLASLVNFFGDGISDNDIPDLTEE